MGPELANDDAPSTGAQLGLFAEADLPEVDAAEGTAQSVYVHFETFDDLRAFGELIGLPLTTATRWLRFPIERPVTGIALAPVIAEVGPAAGVAALVLEAEAFGDLSVEERAERARDLVARLAAALRYAWEALHPEELEAEDEI